MTTTSLRQNRFLASLAAKERKQLLALSTAMSLPARMPLYAADRVPEYAYFITSGIASVVTEMRTGATAEVSIIGQEGVVGAFHLLGPAKISTECFMLIDGSGLRIRFADLKAVFNASTEIRARLLEFVQAKAASLSQVAGCNRLHESDERFARWLLMVQDRVDSDVLNVTQEFLAQMLGAQRTTVTMVAGAFQRSGLIEHTRGRIHIVNREVLEAAACDCYPILKSLLTNLYKG